MPLVSEKQRRAMYAAAEGHSTLGIPQSVGEEFIGKDKAASVRSYDADGRLHVASCNISKANICPYPGEEIPGWRALGLDRDRIYNLLRDPGELAKAAHTFNNLPVLSEHVPVTADSHQPHLVVGSTGTDAAIDGPYLTNSLVIWSRRDIDGIESDEKRELSSAYRYTPDMTPGKFEGVDYDGVMRDIVGNHVALVFEGRAGSDVVIGDEQPMAFKSKRALMLAGGLRAHLIPLLAQDAKMDFGAALKDVSAKTMSEPDAAHKLAERVYGLAQPHLAQDSDLDIDAICKVIDTVQTGGMASDDDEILPVETQQMGDAYDGAGEGEAVAKLLNYLKGKLPDDDYAEAARMVQAEEAMDEKSDDDADDKPAQDSDDDDTPPAAMDQAMKDEIVKQARKEAMAEAAAIRTAEKEVAPIVGELVAMDSAAAVYKVGLKALGVNTDNLSKRAYGETFRAVMAGRAAVQSSVAMDGRSVATARSDFAKRFPNRPALMKG